MYDDYYEAPEPVNREDMQEIDRVAIEELGIPGMVLMENAGAAVADCALDILRSLKLDGVQIVTGKGNNGGDGLVAARHLLNHGEVDNVRVDYLGDVEEQKGEGDAGENLSLLEHYRVDVREVDRSTPDDWLPDPEASILVVDAIFGTGLDGEVREPYDGIIDEMNNAMYPVLSVDIPSGLDATEGHPLGVSVESTLTVTLGAPKEGLLEEEARPFVGQLKVVDIQIPRHLYSSSSSLNGQVD